MHDKWGSLHAWSKAGYQSHVKAVSSNIIGVHCLKHKLSPLRQGAPSVVFNVLEPSCQNRNFC